MSFPEYLRGRVSQDYKNLIIQKLEEIKEQTEGLKGTISPSFFHTHQSLHENLQREIARLQECLEAELNSAQEKISEQLNASIQDYLSGWYNTDISSFDPQIDMLISDIISNVPPPPPPPITKHEELASLSDLIAKLDQGNTQSEILNIVLHHISGWVDRALLFVVKGEQATGWAAFGLGADWDVNRIRKISVDLSKNTVLHHAVQSGEAAYGAADEFADNGDLFMMIGSSYPRAALAFPIKVRGKIAGVLYADSNSELAEKPDLPNLLYVACRAAGSAIDVLPLKPKPAPGKEAAVPAAAPTVMMQPPVQPTPQSFSSSMSQPISSMEQTEGTVVMPAIKPVITEEDQKLHEDAKRFARLLVSEIKLYNEAQVSAGREHKDLYDRLKDDIERSRKMYQDRVPSNIQSASNYFYEELVRTLANGDPSLLGM